MEKNINIPKNVFNKVDIVISNVEFLSDSLALIILIGGSEQKSIDNMKKMIGVLKKELILFKNRMVYGHYDEKVFFEKIEEIYSRVYKLIDIESRILGYGNIKLLNNFSNVAINNHNFTSDTYEQELERFYSIYFDLK